jgi:hypothetical protein
MLKRVLGIKLSMLLMMMMMMLMSLQGLPCICQESENPKP